MKKEDQVRIYKRGKVGKTQLYTTSEEHISNFFFKLLIFNERTEEFTLTQEYLNIKRLKKYSFFDNSYAIGIPNNAPKSSMTQAIEALKQAVLNKDAFMSSNPSTLLPDILRYARHTDLSRQLEIVSPNNYKNIKDFKPFLTNYKGDVLAIPCSAQVGRLKTQFSIFGWYINDKGFIRLRWFPHHKDAVNKRSSTIFIDIRSKQPFFSGSILDSETQDPVFLESLQFLDGRLGQHEQAFQNSFSSFMTYLHQMKKMGKLKSKDSSPNYTYRRRRY